MTEVSGGPRDARHADCDLSCRAKSRHLSLFYGLGILDHAANDKIADPMHSKGPCIIIVGSGFWVASGCPAAACRQHFASVTKRKSRGSTGSLPLKPRASDPRPSFAMTVRANNPENAAETISCRERNYASKLHGSRIL